jgi:autotransporter-associated beta strand protein
MVFTAREFFGLDEKDRIMSKRAFQVPGCVSFASPFVRAALLGILSLTSASAKAASYTWQVQSGDWSIASNWGGTLPTSSDSAWIGAGGTTTITMPGAVCSSLYLGGGGLGTISLTNSLTSANEYVGYSGSGIFNSLNGTNSVGGSLYLGYNTGSSGTYSLSGDGYLSSSYEYLGYTGSGTFTQSGGTNSASYLYLGYTAGSSGTYNLSGRSYLSCQVEYVGGPGTGSTASFTQSGGTNNNIGNFYLGFSNTGTYNLSSGYLSCQNEYLGRSGSGSFTQSGGANNIASNLFLGYYGNGTYNLNGSGYLSCPYENLGYSGSGNFTQSGGTNSAYSLYLPTNASSNGMYNLSGSGYLAAYYGEYVGYSGTGSFTQSGGTNNANSLYIGYEGTYNLNGGLLTVEGMGGRSGTSIFNFNGGTLQASGNNAAFLSGLSAANVQAGGAVIDVQGFNVTISQNLLHDPSLGSAADGGLTKIGAGTLTLTGSNTYTGATTITAGELLVNGSLASPVTVNSGATLGGTGSLSSVTVSSSGQIAPGNPLGALNVSGSLVLATGAVLDYELDTPMTSSTINCGSLLLGGPLEFSNFSFNSTSNFGLGAYDLIQSASTLPANLLGSGISGSIDGFPANLSVQGNDLVLTVVPEPSTLVLLGAGVALLWAFSKRSGVMNRG